MTVLPYESKEIVTTVPGVKNRNLAQEMLKDAVFLEYAVRAGNPCIRALREIPSYELNTMKSLVKRLLVHVHQRGNPIDGFSSCCSTIGSVEESRLERLHRIAMEINGEIENGRTYVAVPQLWHYANYDPVGGYYSSDAGIGLEDSAFSTPCEYNPYYARAYGQTVLSAFRALEGQKDFIGNDKFSVFLCGDANGRILDNVISSLVEDNVDIKSVRFVVIDNSSPILRALVTKYDDMEIEFIDVDARRIGDVLGRSRGVLVAGEELVDVFPQYVFKLDRGIEIVRYIFNRNGEITPLYQPMDKDPYMNELLTLWIAAFDYYKNYFKLIPKEFPFIGLNIGFLELIHSIANSSFKGFWIGGDYGDFYRPDNGEIRPVVVNPFRVYTLEYPQTGKVGPISAAINYVGDITGDVDPELLLYARAMGMKIDFVGTMGDFCHSSRGVPLPTKEEVTEVLMKIIGPYKACVGGRGLPSRKYIKHHYEQVRFLTDLYSGERFNWICRVGDVPELVW